MAWFIPGPARGNTLTLEYNKCRVIIVMIVRYYLHEKWWVGCRTATPKSSHGSRWLVFECWAVTDEESGHRMFLLLVKVEKRHFLEVSSLLSVVNGNWELMTTWMIRDRMTITENCIMDGTLRRPIEDGRTYVVWLGTCPSIMPFGILFWSRCTKHVHSMFSQSKRNMHGNLDGH